MFIFPPISGVLLLVTCAQWIYLSFPSLPLWSFLFQKEEGGTMGKAEGIKRKGKEASRQAGLSAGSPLLIERMAHSLLALI